ncbi:hypothetical protein Hanom_Chr05g00415471 [Helianthus anomalus]
MIPSATAISISSMVISPFSIASWSWRTSKQANLYILIIKTRLLLHIRNK